MEYMNSFKMLKIIKVLKENKAFTKNINISVQFSEFEFF
jgi:hypothetical protein